MLLEGKNAVIDARDEAAVSEHADGIAAAAGSLDVSFSAIAVDHIQGVPLPTLAEVGNVAALMASDHASPLTATVVNVTCGEIAD